MKHGLSPADGKGAGEASLGCLSEASEAKVKKNVC